MPKQHPVDRDGYEKRQNGPKVTAERRLTGWQRGLRWAAWLTFLGLAVLNSQQTSFGALEFLALAVAVGVSIWCMAKPLGGPKVTLTHPGHLRGEFESRTSWGLVLFGVVLTVGGVAAGGAIVYDVATGRASVPDVLRDMAVFAEGWFVEIFTRGAVDAELENTHAYALVFLLIAGVPLLLINLGPFVNRGTRWRVEADGSVSILADGGGWQPLTEFSYQRVSADGSVIEFTPGPGGTPLVLPQRRVFSVEHDARLPAALSAEFFRARLASCGFHLTHADAPASHFVAQKYS